MKQTHKERGRNQTIQTGSLTNHEPGDVYAIHMKSFLAAALALVCAHSPVISAETSKHKLSDWELGPVLFGDKVSRSDMRGKVVVIEHWGVKCPPCIALLPHMAELDKRNRKKGLVVIGAESQGHSKSDIEPLVKKNKIEYPITSGADGPISFNGIPHAFVFDVDGKLIFEGNPGNEDFDRTIRKALRDVKDDEEEAETPSMLCENSTWTNSDGKEIKAAVKEATETEVTFVMFAGKTVKYPLDQLSDESRKKIEDALKAREDAAGGE